MNNRASLWASFRISKIAVLGSALLTSLLLGVSPARAELSTVDPLGFFTNLSSRLLQSEAGLSLNRIQVYPTNQYTPAVHRLLQVTANILDATTNRFNSSFPFLPSVFRPLFTNDNDRIFICGYEEEAGPGYVTNSWRDLTDPTDRTALQPRDYVYGIPAIIGAKKGFPNFNEFALQTVFQITRQLEIRRPSLSAPKSAWQTNQMFILGISNVVGVELWNSYRSNYSRGLNLFAETSLSITLTNNFGLVLTQRSQHFGSLSMAEDNWAGYGNSAMPQTTSFLVPTRTNVIFLPDSIYHHGSQSFTTNLNAAFETGLGFPIPQWGITLNTRLRIFMVDQDTQRVVAFVTLEGLNSVIDLSEAIRDPDTAIRFDGLWSTNLVANQSVPQGVLNQIDIGLGNFGTDTTLWKDYDLQTTPNVAFGVDYFRALYHLSPFKYLGLVNTNLVQLCPFTPTRRISVSRSWQANDPLVHPTRADLQNTNAIERPLLSQPVLTLRNIGILNVRYSPWGGNPISFGDDSTRYNAAIIDPLVSRSDAWNFPDAEPLSLSMLGRVHRATPWQTLYLKSAKAEGASWLDWLHDGDTQSAQLTHPIRDWQIAGLLANLLNTNSPHQLLSINSGETDAWLSALDGFSVLTNTTADSDLLRGRPPVFDSLSVSSNSTQAARVVAGLVTARASQPGGVFRNLGDVLATPELSLASPWLNQSTNLQVQRGITDEAYERLPSQLLPLLRADSVGAAVWSNGNWCAQFTGFNIYPYAIESSSNLLSWFSVSTNYPTNGVFSIPVSAEGNQFFRSRLLP